MSKLYLGDIDKDTKGMFDQFNMCQASVWISHDFKDDTKSIIGDKLFCTSVRKTCCNF